MFNLFAQASRSEPSGQTGLGIGLALVKRLVELHGGEVEAHSEGLGTGCQFTVRFQPVAADAVPASLPSDAAPASSPPRRRILIVDDNRDALESLARLLQLAGHEIHQASDGYQALAVAGEKRPNLMMVDIGMPGMDGYEVARRIRGEDWGHTVMLVAVTGWGQDSDRRRSREAGFDSHWVKPLDAQKLAALLDALTPLDDAAGTQAAAAQPTRRRGDAA